MSCIDNAVGEKDADGDAELITGDEGTTNCFRGDLRHIQDDNSRDKADAETADNTADRHNGNAGGCGLKDATDDKHETSGDDGCSATDKVSDVTSQDGAKESAGRENRRRQRLFPRGKLEGGLVIEVLSASRIRVEDLRVFHSCVLLDEIFHAEDS